MTSAATRLSTAVFLLLTTACSITQEVEPVLGATGRTICVIENPDVRETFLEAYERSLSERGLSVQRIAAGSSTTTCPLTTTYTANWRWDLGMYMAYAELEVFEQGQEVGSAVYDAFGGSARTAKFIHAEDKVRELVTALFPAP